ncbi:bifunctional biotin--[acetyl-CoA-carboxylase] ligase/biotin operon repressor BirA [Pseudoalteromonas sp. G4]|uniref:bifunctional biotin--[acetyl-CoA-carboxylase] ligase/biotin operon repressor BirA n=1 Tax=Pseudoalteromonas sp. G4 TaxID=2992761 RepID=UPI00237DA4C7|nr:bifunctional biotin--[acetyl-CoA-carboxylase] ligase/biotin operon repressor BirA [Pseudoalteromonas sp. G4]MDE3274239.1 bifunctional biotin--[acetyl-CoA-carboxylase] ligase/biotin operon repressor BirA [Pseudoalteromonas sp. G4]
MSQITGTKLAILQALKNGEFISGQLLGEQLGISRAAVAKHIKSLCELGLDIYKVNNKGYCLNQEIALISQHRLESEFQKLAGHTGNFETYASIDSTNTELMQRLASKQALTSGTVIVAEMQNAGRGRRGRVWQSPFGANLYYSYYWLLDDGLQAAMGVSVAVGLAVFDCIKALYNVEVSLKWPNDILVNNHKLAGVLVELDGQPEGPCHLVIGIGLNIAMPERASEHIDQSWVDLKRLGLEVNKNELAAALTYYLEQRLSQYQATGLSEMYSEWNKVNAFAEQLITLNTGQKTWQGICVGIDKQGGLVLRQDGIEKTYYGGEISVRRVNQ